MQSTEKPEGTEQPHPKTPITMVYLSMAAAILCALAGIWWIYYAADSANQVATIDEPTQTEQLDSGQIASMDSPVFHYGPGWTVNASGADPAEPDDPWQEPSGTLTFEFSGEELALLLAVGDYWGYLYVTVDGRPANLLPLIAGNPNGEGEAAGYRTFYAPELAQPDGPGEAWVRVDRIDTPENEQTIHKARIEIWRAWDQQPIRAVAVDALPAQAPPLWPGAALLVFSPLLLFFARRMSSMPIKKRPSKNRAGARLSSPVRVEKSQWLPLAAGAGIAVAVTGIFLSNWLLCSAGMGLLALASIARPGYWVAALLFALPFYFRVTIPLLPNRSFGLIEIGLLGALLVVGAHRWGWSRWRGIETRASGFDRSNPILILVAAIAGWALISTSSATYPGIALYEWRTVFLAAPLFGLALHYVLQISDSHNADDRQRLLLAWLAGATAVSLIAIWQYSSNSMLITAEGVSRARALYGSPNNLALYLERSLIVCLALALFAQSGRWRLLWVVMTLIQGMALLFTFSKGSLLVGVPSGILMLWIGAYWWLRREQASVRPLWWLAALVVLGAVALAPFLATDRFRQLFDLSTGTGQLRLLLWRSSWQMGLDQSIFGVGPDNFLYTYRSWYILPHAWQEPNLNHPHNWILDWWTRLGLPGLLLGTTFFAAGLFALWRAFRDSSIGAVGDPKPALYLGLMGASVAGLTHGLIDASYALPDLMLVWTWIFLLGATADQRQVRAIKS